MIPPTSTPQAGPPFGVSAILDWGGKFRFRRCPATLSVHRGAALSDHFAYSYSVVMIPHDF